MFLVKHCTAFLKLSSRFFQQARLHGRPHEGSVRGLDFCHTHSAIISRECLENFSQRPMWQGRTVFLQQDQVAFSLVTLFFVPLWTDRQVRQTLTVLSLPYHVSKRLGHSPPLVAIYFTFFKLTGWAIIWCSSDEEVVWSKCHVIVEVVNDCSEQSTIYNSLCLDKDWMKCFFR